MPFTNDRFDVYHAPGHPCPDYAIKFKQKKEREFEKQRQALGRLISSKSFEAPSSREISLADRYASKPVIYDRDYDDRRESRDLWTMLNYYLALIWCSTKELVKLLFWLGLFLLLIFALARLFSSQEMQNVFADINSSLSNFSAPKLSAGCSVIQIQYNYPESKEASFEAINEINRIRSSYGLLPINSEERVFNLAVARAKDMRNYSYLDHTNPFTGACPDNMKSSFGLSSLEYVAENAFGNPDYAETYCTRIEFRTLDEPITSWMSSRGHRYNLLYPNHVAGAVGCYKNMCVFLGLNYDRFGEVCYTAAEGNAFWNSTGQQPGEITN